MQNIGQRNLRADPKTGHGEGDFTSTRQEDQEMRDFRDPADAIRPSTGGRREIDSIATTQVIPYEQALDRDARWALSEGSRHFNEKSEVFAALKKIARRLAELNIPYAVVGGMALFRYG